MWTVRGRSRARSRGRWPRPRVSARASGGWCGRASARAPRTPAAGRRRAARWVTGPIRRGAVRAVARRGGGAPGRRPACAEDGCAPRWGASQAARPARRWRSSPELGEESEQSPPGRLGEHVVPVGVRKVNAGQWFSHLIGRNAHSMVRCPGSPGRERCDDVADDAHGAVASRPRLNADARLLAAHEFFRKGEANAEGWSMLIARGRGWESAYRDRWRHDKVVRSTHGVNCTGSCSWNVYVKDGLITWETQAVDYPRTDPAGRTTSRAVAPGARRSRGTRTRRSGSSIRTSAAACWSAGAPPAPSPRTRSRRSRRSPKRAAPRRARPRRVRALRLGGGERADRRRDGARDP